jgi:hypothetical protein
VSEYLVEVYIPRAAPAAARPNLEHVSGVAAQLTRSGTQVNVLSSIFVPEEETCFYHFEGQSGDAVREVATKSGLLVERVMEAVSESTMTK